MKTSLYTCAMVLSAASLLACGDDSSGTGGGGGEDATTTATTTATTGTTTATTGPTTTSTTATSTSTGTGGEGGSTVSSSSSNSGGGGSGAGDCIQAAIGDPQFAPATAYGGLLADNIGADFEDYAYVNFSHLTELTLDLSTTSPTDPELTDYVFAGEDFDPAIGYTSVFFANEGTLTVTDTTYAVEGVRMVELDLKTFEPLVGGRCLVLADFGGDLGRPLLPDSWTCDPAYFGAGPGDGCDCTCGAYDPDCDIATDPIYGCEDSPDGPYCDATGVCADAPAWWTCDAADLDDGTTCNCECGGPDPDCDPALALPIDGCTAGQTCGFEGVCLDPENICDDLTDNDEDGSFDCDDTTACQGTNACAPGAAAIGLGCDANTDCAASDSDPICLTEAFFGYPGGQCGEWCDLVADDCPVGNGCVDFGVTRGICMPTCDTSADCDNPEAECADGFCVAGAPPPPPVEWICNAAFYGATDGCDCGCGAVDPDCANTNDTSCEYCIDPSCGDAGDGTCDLALLVDNNNAVCN